MAVVTFETFDPSPYLRVPNVNIRSLFALMRALIEVQPIPGSEKTVKLTTKFGELLTVGEAELTDRHRELVPAAYGPPAALDGGSDGLWTLCSDRLEVWSRYEHAGFDVFIAQPDTPLGAKLSLDRDRAERARVLKARLFADGLGFLRGPPREQAEHVNSLLRLITADDLHDDLAELVGPTLVDQLFLLQPHYDAMVVDQLSKAGSSGQNLRALRLDCMRTVNRYSIAVLDLLDEDEPKTLTLVTSALCPILVLREMIAASSSQSPSDESAAGLDTLPDPKPEPVSNPDLEG